MNKNFDKVMKRLRIEFIESLKVRMQNMEHHWNGGDLNASSSAPLSMLCDEAHKTAGAAGTYGFKDITDTARELEDLLRNCMNDHHFSVKDRCLVGKRFDELKRLISQYGDVSEAN